MEPLGKPYGIKVHGAMRNILWNILGTQLEHKKNLRIIWELEENPLGAWLEHIGNNKKKWKNQHSPTLPQKKRNLNLLGAYRIT
jgi:hypothetical protein